MASITNLEAVRARLTEVPALTPVKFEPAPAAPTAEQQAAQPEPQAKEAPASAEPDPLELVHIELTRECAEWLLADIDKRRKRLRQSVNDPKTGQAKRRKHERELNFVAYTSATIHNSLNNPNHETN